MAALVDERISGATLVSQLFQVLHVLFAFPSVFHDPLRELRLDALDLFVSVPLDTPGTRRSAHSARKQEGRVPHNRKGL